MSQIAWWTLDGHLKDSIGNNNMVITGNGITIDNLGKIGRCYKSSHVKENLKSNKPYRLKGSQSYCCWFKLMSDNDEWSALVSTYNHADRTGLASVIRKSSDGFTVNITAGYADTYSNNMCQVGGEKLQFDTWYHMSMIYNVEEQYFKIFINGELYAKSTNIPGQIKFSSNSVIGLMTWDISKNYYFSSIKMNDVRIFDHALSIKEVQEIAKAKILHIDFSQEVNNSNIIANRNKIVTDWRYKTNINVELMANMSTPDGGKVYKLTKTGNEHITLLRDSGINVSNDEDSPVLHGKCYSFYLWCKKGNVNKEISIDISDYVGYHTVVLADDWQLMKVTGILRADGYCFTDIDIHTFDNGEYCYISQPQTTEGTNILKIIDPIDNNRNTKLPYNGKIIDKSGFGNDFSLESYGPSKWEKDTGLGMGSMHFDNGKIMSYRNNNVGEYIQSINPVYISDQFTLSYWCKGNPNTSYDNYRRENIYSTGWAQMCSLEGGIGSSQVDQRRCGFIYSKVNEPGENYFHVYDERVKLHDGNWHNVTITIDCVNKTGKLFYDGIKIKEAIGLADFHWVNTFRKFIIGSAWSLGYGPWYGNLADIRVYATYLSDKDCIALYNQKLSLTKNGTLFCSNFNESKNLSSNILDYTSWTLGTRGSQSKQQSNPYRTSSFSQITGDDLNEIVIRKNPKNEDDIVWRGVRKDTNTVTNGDGGFNTWQFRIDKNKLYRCSIWIKRPYLENSTGNWYMGVYAYNENGSIPFITNGSNGSDSNFYHYSSARIFNNDWFLVIGYILPNNINDSIFRDDINYLTKIYNSKGKLLDTHNYKCKFPNDCTKMVFRSYLYYSNIQETEQYFYRPRVDLIDGTEPSINDLIHLRECDNIYKSTMNGVTKESVFTEEKFSEVGNLDYISAYYPLIEDFKDYSGNKLHLQTAYNNDQQTPPLFTGRGVKFAQSGRYISYNKDNKLLDLSETFTISFNIQLNGEIVNVNSGQTRTTLFEKDLYDKDFSINLAQSNRQLQLQLYTGHVNSNDSNNTYVYAQAELGDINYFINNFVNIIIVKTRTSLIVYKNGQKLTSTVTQQTPRHGSGPLRIASGYCNTTGCTLNHIKIFKRPITEKEALTEYKWYTNQAKMLINKNNEMYTAQLIED